ncbi:T9SS type A sorting domain-containing protein [Hymenobacter pini]|uniref:T9SS type A sorting domain-containing protein n=1 Tax=Hymenobacter pini TaxID=2880879 RepID=UPI001CF5A9B3|nr:T9SS type A sorting domain-containing protein [Hymenobacter pini]MCA8830795.1 T9SS type A sorting domain-containing protein [Hymenobacter pini]
MQKTLRYCGSLLIMLLATSGSLRAQVPGFNWAVTGPQPVTSTDQAQALHAVTDANGNTYVTGSFRGTLTLGPSTLTSVTSSDDIFVAKLAPDGSYAWAVQAGGPGDDVSMAIARDASGRLYITGHTASYTATFGALPYQNSSNGPSLFLARLNADGRFERVSAAGGTASNFVYPRALTVDAAGNAYVTGSMLGSSIAFGYHPLRSFNYNAFVAKLDAAGEWQWARVVNDQYGYDFGNAVGLDAAGNVYVAGTFNGEAPHFDQIALQGGGSMDRLFVARLDGRYGRWDWAVRSGNGASGCQGLVVNAAGACYLTGSIRGQQASIGPISLPSASTGTDALVGKLSSEGVWQWARRFTGTGTDTGLDLALDSNGGLTVTGSFTSPQLGAGSLPTLRNRGKADVFVAQLDTTGQWRWALNGGGSGDDFPFAVTTAPNGDLRVAGYFQGPELKLGPTVLPGGGVYVREYYASRLFVANIHDAAQNSAGNFTIWPNPSQGTVWATGLPANAPVQVFDALGRLVVPNARPTYEAAGLQLPILPAGMYFVRCGKETRRLELL